MSKRFRCVYGTPKKCGVAKSGALLPVVSELVSPGVILPFGVDTWNSETGVVVRSSLGALVLPVGFEKPIYSFEKISNFPVDGVSPSVNVPAFLLRLEQIGGLRVGMLLLLTATLNRLYRVVRLYADGFDLQLGNAIYRRYYHKLRTVLVVPNTAEWHYALGL